LKAVFDTSPISYLLLIGESELLPALYDQLFIPLAVAAELRHPEAPPVVREWMANPPAWLEICRVQSRIPGDLRHLQPGEREAILLAEDLKADQVVIDDRAAREAAMSRGLELTGLIGILDQAARRSLIDLAGVVERLRGTSFHIAPWLLKELLDRHSR
jgi:predicted nucleic acid-binding protein